MSGRGSLLSVLEFGFFHSLHPQLVDQATRTVLKGPGLHSCLGLQVVPNWPFYDGLSYLQPNERKECIALLSRG